MVDLRAIASRTELILWTSFSINLNRNQGFGISPDRGLTENAFKSKMSKADICQHCLRLYDLGNRELSYQDSAIEQRFYFVN